MKTFWTPGRADQQLPDGSVTWTVPSGHTYTTTGRGVLVPPTGLAWLKFVLSAQAGEWGQTFAGYRIERLLGRLATP